MLAPVLVLVLVAAVLRILVAVQLDDHPLLQPVGEMDSGYYVRLANRVADGDLWPGGEVHFVSPLYVYFLAGVLALTGRSLLAAKLVQAILGAIAVGLVFATARTWFGHRAARVAGALAATTGVFVFYEAVFLQAALDPFLTALALYLVTRAATGSAAPVGAGPTSTVGPAAAASAQGARLRWWLAAGVAVGLLALNRPNALLYAAALVLLVALPGVLPRTAGRGTGDRRRVGRRRILREAAAVALGVCLALAPVTIGNLVASGELVLISSHGGLNFYIGNHGDADGTYRAVPGVTPSIAGQARDTREVAEAALGRELSAAEVSSHFYGRALRWVAADPGAAVRLLGRKIAYVANAAHLTLNYSYAYYSRDEPTALRLLVVGPWLLIPLGLLGVAWPPRGRGYVAWVAFVPIYALSVAIFFVSERYRLPLLVPLCVGAGGAAVDLWTTLRRALGANGMRAARGEPDAVGVRAARRGLAVRVTALILLAVLANLDLGLDDGRSRERTEMAVALVDARRYERAEGLVARASPDHPQPGILHFRVGRAYLEGGRFEDAVRHLESARGRDPDQGEVDFSLGQALTGAGRHGAAADAFARASRLGVQIGRSRLGRARALAASGERGTAVAELGELAGILEERAARAIVGDAGAAGRRPHPEPGLALSAGNLAIELDALDTAQRLLRAEVSIDPSSVAARERLGLVLARAGLTREAIVYLEAAAALAPQEARIHMNLGILYAQEGDLEAARDRLRHALRLRPDYARAREVLERLESALAPE